MELKNLKIAHRGIFDNKKIPENSLIAFHRAIIFHIPIELDIQLTKDNIVVVFHDSNLKRMCGIDKYIEDLTWEELKKIPLLNTEEYIPSLVEVLSLVQGQVFIDIELKKTDNYKLLCDLVLEMLNHYEGSVLLKSFQPSVVKYLKKNTNFPVGLLMTDYPPSKFYSYLISSMLLVKYCRPDFLAVNKNIILKKRFQRFRIKKPLFVWTINSLQEFNTFVNYADSFLCNHLPYEKK